jgi:hypothetical protein
MKQLIIAVTKADIARGQRLQADSCPIALSLKRRLRRSDVEVDYDRVRWGEFVGFPITRKMEQWMEAFDKGQKVKPTAFFVDVGIGDDR